MSDAAHELANRLAHQCLMNGDNMAWFDALYTTANGDASLVPWAHLEPNALLVKWLARTAPGHEPGLAVQVGCGLGDDGEALALHGFATTAFDISPRAVDWCMTRFPDSPVNYVVADLLVPPADWVGRFDLVYECFTVQALPEAMRQRAIAAVCDLVSAGGTVLVVTRLRDIDTAVDGPPWPLTLKDMELFDAAGLERVCLRESDGSEEGRARRCIAEFRKPA